VKKVTPSNCKLKQCKYNVIPPGENAQECIGCEGQEVRVLYKTTITFDMFVEAGGEDEARDTITSDACDELDAILTSGCFFPEIEEVTDLSKVPGDWRSAIPYGSYNDEPIEKMLNKYKAKGVINKPKQNHKEKGG